MGPPFVTLVETHVTFCKSFPFHMNKTIYSGHSVKRAIALQSKKTSLVFEHSARNRGTSVSLQAAQKRVLRPQKKTHRAFFFDV